MKKLSRSIASKFMQGVMAVSIFCAYSQDANAATYEFVMSGTYVDNYSQARWNDIGNFDYQWIYFMNNTFFGNHEVMGTHVPHWPNAGTKPYIRSTFDYVTNRMISLGVPEYAFTDRTVHGNLYYMFDAIIRSLNAKPTYDVPFGGIKIPNAIAKAMQPMATYLVTPNAVLTIAPVAQTSDLKCTSAKSASQVVVQAQPPCRRFVALLSIFHFLNFLNAFIQWAEDNPNAATNLWNGALASTAATILFFAYEYWNAGYNVQVQAQNHEQVQSDLDDALELGEAGLIASDEIERVLETVAAHNNSVASQSAQSAMPTAMNNATRAAASQAANPSVPPPPTFPPVGSE